MKPNKKSLERDLEHAERTVKDLEFRLLNGTHLNYQETYNLKTGLKLWSKKVQTLRGKVAKAS